MQSPRRGSNQDPLTQMEAEAYQAGKYLPAEPLPPRSKDEPTLYAPIYRPEMLRPWPRHTDFRADNLEVRD
jgi:hypothetical protein